MFEDLQDYFRSSSLDTFGTLKYSRLLMRSCSFRVRTPVMKLICFTNHPWEFRVLSSTDPIEEY
jgi:hypothetical protein